MPIYEFNRDAIRPVEETSFQQAGFRERDDLQRLLREHIGVISPETLIIAEEFGDWDDSRRRVDLLGVDKSGNLVVIELKRTEDGGHMELQAIRYAAMVSNMTFEQAVTTFEQHLGSSGESVSAARQVLLDFLEWSEPRDEDFAQEVRIVLASAEFSRELTSSVLWLLEHDIDIRCVRLKPYRLENRLLVDVQQIIPLPEATDYQVLVREKSRKERESRGSNIDFSKFDVRVGGELRAATTKRGAIFFVCQFLCSHGIDPRELSNLFDWRSNKVWYFVDGSVDATEFGQRALEKSKTSGPNYDDRRWYCRNEQLVHTGGKTYAFSNQWGGDDWRRAMTALQSRFPKFEIQISQVD